MANSTFWRGLGERFLALKTATQADSWQKLKAVWTADNSVTPPMERWDLEANDRGFQLRFETIAETGGDALSPNDFVDPLYAWLAALVRESHVTSINRKLNANGFELDNLIEASINLCASMESRRLGAERRQRYLDAKPAPPAVAVPSSPPIQPELPNAPIVPANPVQSLAEQIGALRIETQVTQEALAELVDFSLRTVQRHESGETKPNKRQIFRYEKEFSKILNRKIVINKLS